MSSDKERVGLEVVQSLNVTKTLSLAGVAVTATAADLNSATVLSADLAVLTGTNAAGLTTADVETLVGVSSVSAAALKRVAKVALHAVDTGGGVFSWANPEAVSIIVNRVTLDVTTPATGACSVSVGTTAVSGTTSSANLIDTLDVHTAAGVFDNLADGGSLGKMKQKLAAGKWVTASKASGASAGLVGNAYIEYLLI